MTWGMSSDLLFLLLMVDVGFGWWGILSLNISRYEEFQLVFPRRTQQVSLQTEGQVSLYGVWGVDHILH